MASLGATQDIFQIQQCNPGRAIPMMLTGTEDLLVPYQGGPMDGDVPDIVSSDSLLRFWQGNNNCLSSSDTLELADVVSDDNSTLSQFSFEDCSCQAEVRHLRVNGGGHTWPGVELPDLELVAGETNEDILASQALWSFFQNFTLCQKLITSQEQILAGVFFVYALPHN